MRNDEGAAPGADAPAGTAPPDTAGVKRGAQASAGFERGAAAPAGARPSRAAELAAARAALPLSFQFNPELPITAQREEILAALGRAQVLIVAGDTGSGKSTQLPQYCLAAGRGIAGLIAHTQPRRIAARALALRIAEELEQPLGQAVGFRVRFNDRVSAATRLVLVTDGLLLAELGSDPLLRRYDTIVLDEAHERSLNIDLLLGALKRILPKRPELKVIVTSATLEVERIAAFFDGAPVITVGGRAHPIEVRYREPAGDADDPDLPALVLESIQEALTEPGQIGSGDMLVFLPGEREIRDVGETLRRELDKVEVLDLYSRLSWEEQSRVFERGSRQRVVLATNVAETSITVPGIRTVVDSGLARISRYSPRSRLQRLPIEPVSKASADQRKGRCGRLGPGLCLRLFGEADFEARPQFTEPEVLRTNLAALLLKLAADGLGRAEEFPFIDPPDARALNDGYRLLQELQALDAERNITRLGRSMSRLPLDPRLSRALIESKRFHAESELLAIVAGLSVPEFRLAAADAGRGAEAAGGRARAGMAMGAAGAVAAGAAVGTAAGTAAGAGSSSGRADEAPPAANAAASLFEDPRSEFSSLVRVWRAYRAVRAGPRRELRRWCKERRFSLLRLSEWDDVHAQVTDRAGEIGIRAADRQASYAAVHRSLLAGFSTMVGLRGEDGAYAGTRGINFHVFPGSPLARRRPRWVMAANIVETSRVFARRVAQVEPNWIEDAARHLLKREYLQPDWSEEREEVVARERVSLLGLTLSAHRIVNYGPIAPEESRRLFAREALVYGRLRRRPDWLIANDEALSQAAHVEERLRSRDLLLGPEALVEFYDRRLPRQVSSGATLDHLTRHLSAEDRQRLLLREQDIFARHPDAAELLSFPETVSLQGMRVPVRYRFAPGEPGDGATLELPLLAVPRLTRADVDAAVPGFALPRIEALLRSLPKNARRQLIPMAETAAAYMSERDPSGALDALTLRAWLKQHRGVAEAELHFDPSVVPAHLLPHLEVPEARIEAADVLSLPELRRMTAAAARAALDLRAATAPGGNEPWRVFVLDAIPLTTRLEAGTSAVTDVAAGEGAVAVPDAAAPPSGGAAGSAARPGPLDVFPTLEWRGALRLRYDWSAEEAARHWRIAAPRLARTILAAQMRDLSRVVAGNAPLSLIASPYARAGGLTDVILSLAVRSACFEDAPAPRERGAFEAAVEAGRGRLHEHLEQTVATALGWFNEARAVRRAMEQGRGRATAEESPAALEARAHLERLLSVAALETMPPAWLRQLPRYLKAEERRWERAGARGAENPQILVEIETWENRLRALERQVAAEQRHSPELEELGYWIEEYRVSLYAQELKTLGPVSAARLEERAARVEAWIAR